MSVRIYDELLGKVIIKIELVRDNTKTDDLIRFYLSNGEIYDQYHENDCCECVRIEDINGDLNDLRFDPLLQAEETTQNDPDASESGTWTFYKFATKNGYVTIRWYGSSNGYYSETSSINKSDDSISIKELRDYKLCKIEEIKKESN